MAKWYTIQYKDEYGNDLAHTFSGNEKTVRMVIEAYNIPVVLVSTFTINDEPADITHYLKGE
jgi:hypothetical protein